MFFEKLSMRQKTALLALAKRMMIADAKVRVEEDALYHVLKTELGGGVEAPTQDVFGPIDVSEFDDPHSRMVLLVTLAIMAHVDDHLHDTEYQVLNDVTNQIGFPPELVKKAMDIAERQGDIVMEIQALFTEAG